MIYTLETVGVVQGKMNEYLDFIGKEFMPIYQRLGIKMEGSWRTSFAGSSNECFVLYSWESIAQWEKLRDARNADKDWQRLYQKYQTLTTGAVTRILQPNPYSNLK
jgi:hypothetical protein